MNPIASPTVRLTARQRAMLAEMGIRVWGREPEQDTPRPAIPRNEAGHASGAAQAAASRAQPGHAAPPPAPLAATPGARPLPAPAHRAAPAAASPTAAAPKHATAPVPSAPSLTPRPAPDTIAAMDWDALETAVTACRACALCAGRTQTVFGVGSRRADWMVVGEAPGEQEDRLGQPFVGPSGKLLDNMLAAIGVSRQADEAADISANTSAADTTKPETASPEKSKPRGVYIANVLKCRPPGNRNPQPDEVACCEPYLRRQVALVQPKIILTMGRFAVQSLLQTSDPIGRLRGRVHQYQSVPVIVSYHPAYLLRSLPEKAKAWQDLCLAVETMQNNP